MISNDDPSKAVFLTETAPADSNIKMDSVSPVKLWKQTLENTKMYK